MNRTVQIIFKESDWEKLSQYLLKKPDIESGTYAIFKTSANTSKIKFLVNKIIIPRDRDYHKRSATAVAFTSGFTESAFQACEKINGHLLDIHTHPWSDQVKPDTKSAASGTQRPTERQRSNLSRPGGSLSRFFRSPAHHIRKRGTLRKSEWQG